MGCLSWPKRWEISPIGKAYLVATALESLALVVFAIGILVTGSDEQDETRELSFYAVVAILVTLCQLYFSIDSIFTENVYQFAASIVSAGMVWLWSLFQIFSDTLDLKGWFNALPVVLLAVTSAFFGIFLVMSPFVYQSFGWRLYKEVSAEIHVQHMYSRYQAFLSLLKFDLELGVLLVVMGSFFLFDSSTQVVLNVLAMVATVAWAYVGYNAMTHERSKVLVLYAAFAVVEPVYIAVTLFYVERNPNEFEGVTFNQFVIVGTLAILCRVLLGVAAFFVYRDFGKGLRKYKAKDTAASSPDGQAAPLKKNDYGAAASNGHDRSGVGGNGEISVGSTGEPAYLISGNGKRVIDLESDLDDADDGGADARRRADDDLSDSELSITDELKNSKHVQTN